MIEAFSALSFVKYDFDKQDLFKIIEETFEVIYTYKFDNKNLVKNKIIFMEKVKELKN